MRSFQAWLFCFLLTSPPVVMTQQQSSFSSPIRVRVSEFIVTLAPPLLNMTEIEAEKIRDVAETLFEEFLMRADWDAQTVYEYAGLTGIEEFFVDDSRSPPVSVIKVRGGLVVFSGNSTVVPTEHEIEMMLFASLYPDSSDEPSLTDLLNSLGDFGVVEVSGYEAIQSHSPSQNPSFSFVQTDSPTFSPSIFTLQPSSAPTTFTPSREPETLSPSPQPTVFDIITELPSPSPSRLTSFPSFSTTDPTQIEQQPNLPSGRPTIADVATEPPSTSSSRVTSSPSFAPTDPTPIEQQPNPPSGKPTSLNVPTELPSPSPSRMTSSPSYSQTTSAPIEQQPRPTSDTPSSIKPTLSQSNMQDPALGPSSLGPSLSNSSGAQTSQNPTVSTTVDEGVSLLSGGNQASSDLTSAGQNQVMIGTAVGGFLAVCLLSVLFVLGRRGRRQQVWKAGIARAFPDDDLEDTGLHIRDHLREHSGTDGKSEAGSSIFVRLRNAASMPPQRPLLKDSPETTPQSSSGSASENPFDTGGIEIALVSPNVTKDDFVETSSLDRSVRYNLFLTPDQSAPTEWSNVFECALTSTDTAVVLDVDRWGNYTANHENDTNPGESDTDGNFTIGDGDAWDFDDNDEDENEVDPFSTSVYFNGADTETLLGAIVERSSTMSPGNL